MAVVFFCRVLALGLGDGMADGFPEKRYREKGSVRGGGLPVYRPALIDRLAPAAAFLTKSLGSMVQGEKNTVNSKK